MDLQTRKLNAIRYLINLQDEKIFRKIEATIDTFKSEKETELPHFTPKQLVDRAKRSNEEIMYPENLSHMINWSWNLKIGN